MVSCSKFVWSVCCISSFVTAVRIETASDTCTQKNSGHQVLCDYTVLMLALGPVVLDSELLVLVLILENVLFTSLVYSLSGVRCCLTLEEPVFSPWVVVDRTPIHHVGHRDI